MSSGSNSGRAYRPDNTYYANLNVSFTENSTSIPNNTSNISISGSISKATCSWYVTGAGAVILYWHDNHNNTDVEIGREEVPKLGYDGINSVSVSGTINATHNDDGTLSGYAYVRWELWQQYGNYIPNTTNVSTGWVTLTTIARKSVPTVSTSSVSMPASGNAITVNTNRASSSFTHTITLKVGNTQIAQRTGVGASTTFTYADLSGIYAAIPSATSTTVSVICETFSGSTSVGSNTTSFTANISNDTKPTFSNYTYSDTNANTTAITENNQLMVQGYSTPTIVISTGNKATANYSATMSKYSMNFAQASAVVNYSTSQITQNLASPTQSGSLIMTVSAVDSREYSAAVTKNVTVIPYAKPVINASATRTGNYYSETTLHIAGSFSGIPVSNVNKNTINTTSGVQYRYKKSSESTWGAWTNRAITISGTNYSAVDLIMSFDNAYQWDIQVQATDRLATTTVSLVLPVGLPVMYIGKDGRVALGGVPTETKASGHNSTFQINNGKAYIVNNTAGQDAFYWSRRTDTNTSVGFGAGSDGTNHGIWSSKLDKWLIYGDASNCYLQGQAIAGRGGSWIQARDTATAKNNSTNTGSHWAPVVSSKSNSGDWSIGCLGNVDNLYFVHISDADYAAGINEPDTTIWFNKNREHNLRAGVTTSDGWTKIDIASNLRLWFKVYTESKTFSAGSWGWLTDVSGPSGLTSNKIGWCTAQCVDSAITTTGEYQTSINNFHCSWTNHYNGSVTDSVRRCLFVLDWD